MADFGDFTAFDANIGLVGRDQCPIDNRAAFNNGIELRHNKPSFRVLKVLTIEKRIRRDDKTGLLVVRKGTPRWVLIFQSGGRPPTTTGPLLSDRRCSPGFSPSLYHPVRSGQEARRGPSLFFTSSAWRLTVLKRIGRNRIRGMSPE